MVGSRAGILLIFALMHYPHIHEEELKNKVARDYFPAFDCTRIVGKIDFCALPRKIPGHVELFQDQPLLWAEAKANKRDVVAMFAQLILTIGKARSFDKNLPPAFLGAFDAEKIAFVEYAKIQHLFFANDFNWNVAPSDLGSKEFAEIKSLIEDILATEKHLYFFGKDDKELRFFIRSNLARPSAAHKIHIDKNNFVPVYLRWLDEVKPLIDFDFAKAKGLNILDSDFYLADLFVDDNDTRDIADDVPIKEDIFVVFRNENYEITRENLRTLFDATVRLKDKGRYQNFWSRYKRPPVREFQDYMVKRRDLIVPQDVRERKGAFFTPKQWVELSQKYIADTLGADWQEEYYVWDCAAGTGNLLAGLTNKRNIWASTLDQADVNVMHDRIKNGANLFEDHVFQFDFLNDEFFDIADKKGNVTVPPKLPKPLQDILKDPEKRKKLVIYINPPYAEAGNRRTFAGKGENKPKTATGNKTHEKYRNEIGKASNELFAQFMIRIYCEMPGCLLANFSTLKNLQAPNFSYFRDRFRAALEKIFLVPASTFDNVKGSFPIGFFVWDTSKEKKFSTITADVFDERGQPSGHKKIFNYDGTKRINQWIAGYKCPSQNSIGFLVPGRSDFQDAKRVNLIVTDENRPDKRGVWANTENLIPVCVYFAAHHSIKPTWLNDRDQFLCPDKSWESDLEFHHDCLAFTLFHSQNRITAKEGTNHWIPFTEDEVGCTKTAFESRFMSDFIKGKIKKTNGNGNIFDPPKVENGTKCRFSPEAQAVFDTGKELWRYYHAQKHGVNPNASLYDIREYFQGRNEKGKMNNGSTDGRYTELIASLREKLKTLADKIAEKVHEHGFLAR